MSAYETIEIRIENRIAIITLNRPAVLNAINAQMMRDLTSAMAAFSTDPGIAAILIHGAGRAFCAGFDMKEASQRGTTGTAEWRAILEADFDFIMQFWESPKPTIAAVHGHCLAGGLELALACDLAVAAEGTRFAEPEARFGSGIIALLLPWHTAPKMAKEILLTATDRIDASLALSIGLVNRVVPAGQELAEAREIARDLATAAPLVIELTKRSINRTYEIMGMRQALLAALDTALQIATTGGAERAEFGRINREKGLKAALAWREGRYAR